MPELAVIAEQLLAPVPGGTGRYTRELLRALADTTPAGWEVTSVVSSSGDPANAVVPGVAGPRVLRIPRRGLVAAWERGVPVSPGGDSVHAMTPLAPPPKRGRRLVVTVHDTVPWSHPETLTPRGVSWHRRVIRRAARRADVLVVPTLTVAAELGRYVDISPGRLKVIGEGVTSALLDEGSEPVGLPPRYLLAVGTIEPRKGYEYLVEAMTSTQLPLVVVGEQGWGEVDLLRTAEDNGVAKERIHLLGAVDDPTLAAVLRSAHALVMPSLAEGFGLPVIEAMAAGVPVVHSDAPSLVEVAGDAGMTVPRADPAALAAAVEAVDERRAELVAAGMRRAERFTWERAAREVWRTHQYTDR